MALPDCGSMRGYYDHGIAGTVPCVDCKAANAAKSRDYYYNRVGYVERVTWTQRIEDQITTFGSGTINNVIDRLHERFDVSEKTIRRVMQRMYARGELARSGNGGYMDPFIYRMTDE